MNFRVTLIGNWALVSVITASLIFAADHREAPLISLDSRADITDVYAFVGPVSDSTVLLAGFTPFAGQQSPYTFGTDIIYQFNIYDTPPSSPFDVFATIAYRVTFGEPDSAGAQPLKLYRAEGTAANGHTVNPDDLILSAMTRRIHELPGGGRVFAGPRDDPFFFDEAGLAGFLGEAANGRTFNDGNEEDAYADANVMAIVLEIPNAALPSQGGGDDGFGVWASTAGLDSGSQRDRMGRPLINRIINSTGSLINSAPGNLDAFNHTHPADDQDWDPAVKAALSELSASDSEGPLTTAQLDQISSLLLPDTLLFTRDSPDLPQPLDGRSLETDAADFQLNLLSGGDPLGLVPGRDAVGGVPTDGIGPDGDLLMDFPFLGPPNVLRHGGWSQTTVFGEHPLEAKLGLLTEGTNPSLLGAVIWNDGAQNVLTGITIPPPYNGDGVSTRTLLNDPVLFALGDVCTDGTTAVLPYIVDFNVGVTTVESPGFGNPVFTNSIIPGTVAEPYDSADCGVTRDGCFISAHNDLDNAIDIWKANDCHNYTFYGRYPGVAVAGPFDGGLRDQLGTNRDGWEAAGLYQRTDGPIQVVTFDTSKGTPVFSSAMVLSQPPPAGFTVLKESGGFRCLVPGLPGFCFTFNVDGRARVTAIPFSEPGAQTSYDLGMVDNGGGKYFPFSGGTIVGEPFQTNVIWGEFHVIDEVGAPAGTDAHFPNIAAGGPVDGCHAMQFPDSFGNFNGTFLLFGQEETILARRKNPPGVFREGFEPFGRLDWLCD